MTGKTNSNTINGVGEHKATLVISLQYGFGPGTFFEVQPDGTLSLSSRTPGNDMPITTEDSFVTAKIVRYQNKNASPTGKPFVVTLKKRCYVTAGGLKGIIDNVYDAGTILSWDVNASSTQGEPPLAVDNRLRHFLRNQGIVISEV